MQEALLAAEELAWDKKMSALRQPVNKGPSPGNIQVEQTEDDPEVSQQAHVHVSQYLSLLLRSSVCVAPGRGGEPTDTLELLRRQGRRVTCAAIYPPPRGCAAVVCFGRAPTGSDH